jgi:hypothetical protein
MGGRTQRQDSSQQLERSEEGYTISAEPLEFGYSSDVNVDVTGNIRARAEAGVLGGYQTLLDHMGQALGMVGDALILPERDDAVPPTLLACIADWGLEQLASMGTRALDGISARLPVGTGLAHMGAIHASFEAARAQATSAQQALSLSAFITRLTLALAGERTALLANALPWLESLQAFANQSTPQVQQQMYDYLAEWSEALVIACQTTRSAEASFAEIAGQWAAFQGGRVEVQLHGLDMAERRGEIRAPYGDQLARKMEESACDFRQTGLDVHVIWLPEPMFPIARMEGIVPVEGSPAITFASNTFSADDVARFKAALSDPMVAFPGKF